jgi:hypothetical protein
MTTYPTNFESSPDGGHVVPAAALFARKKMGSEEPIF